MFTTIDGVRLHYEQEGQGTDLILIHGLGMSLRDWDNCTPDLAKRHRVLRIDVRGFGESDKPPGPYSPQLFARDLAGVVYASQITRAHVAGISMGGVIAQRLALDFPDLVRSLTLMSTSSEVNAQAQAAWEELATGVEQRGFAAAEGMADRLHAASFTKAYPERVQNRQRLTAANDPHAFAAAARAVSAFNWTADLRRIQVPALILQGLEDVLTPPGGAVKMNRALPHSRLLMIPECGHFVPDEKPEVFIHSLLAFLAGVDFASETNDMTDNVNPYSPTVIEAIHQDTLASGFSMASEPQTGSLLRTLAASKPSGAFLELGTGTGLSTAWILDGMNQDATLVSVDNDENVQAIARHHLDHDPRVSFRLADGATFLASLSRQKFDYIFADTWPGKYDHLDEALALLKPGGLYIIDDMLPQANWPAGHDLKVTVLVTTLEQRSDLTITKLNWATGLIIAAKRS